MDYYAMLPFSGLTVQTAVLNTLPCRTRWNTFSCRNSPKTPLSSTFHKQPCNVPYKEKELQTLWANANKFILNILLSFLLHNILQCYYDTYYTINSKAIFYLYCLIAYCSYNTYLCGTELPFLVQPKDFTCLFLCHFAPYWKKNKQTKDKQEHFCNFLGSIVLKCYSVVSG